jgi:hypothetical protein
MLELLITLLTYLLVGKVLLRWRYLSTLLILRLLVVP